MRNTSKKAKISQKMDCCEDFLFSPTTMELYSDDQILIRQCFGLISYDENSILLKCKGFSAKISGKALTMKAGGSHTLFISGKISSINIFRGEK